MAEQKIILVIDEEGAVSAKTHGFQGKSCLEALDDILDSQPVTGVEKTDEFHQKATSKVTTTIKQGR